MRNVADKICTENQSTHFMFRNLLRKSCRLRDGVKDVVEPAGHKWQYNAAQKRWDFHAG